MSTVLADRLLQTAIESNMKIGDKLPGEVELADRFHVSRVSIREAINGLKFLGMLDAAPRRGTTMAAGQVSRVPDGVFEPFRRGTVRCASRA